MKEGTVVGLRQPGSFSDDPLTDILRSGARQLLAQAIEAEVGAYIAAHSDLTGGSGRRRVVRKLNDEQMLQFMGRENLEDYNADFLTMLQTWEAAVNFWTSTDVHYPQHIEISRLIG